MKRCAIHTASARNSGRYPSEARGPVVFALCSGEAPYNEAAALSAATPAASAAALPTGSELTGEPFS